MVGSIGEIGSYAAGIFQYQGLFESNSTSSALSFDEMVSNGIISNTEDEKASTGITAMGGGSEKDDSKSTGGSENEMDLNRDGQITVDEVIRYMQMQMTDDMSQQMSSEDGSFEMGRQAQQVNGVDDFKNKLASNAYQAGQKLTASVTEMITDSLMFMV